MFYEPSTEKIYSSLYDFRMEHRDTSYGELSSEEERNIHGLYTLHQTYPEHDSELQDVLENGVEYIGGQYRRKYLVNAKVLSAEQINTIMLSRYTAALGKHLDDVAKQRRYDNRITCSLRAGYPGPFQAEGVAFATWMDSCNAAAYQIWSDVRNGVRAAPASIEAFIAELPVIDWPAPPVTY